MVSVLTIAGSDSGGGAGIQADLKSIQANNAYGLSVITAITAQNTVAVTRVFEVPVEVIEAQVDAVFDDFAIAAVKTGMLSSAAIAEAVSAKLAERAAPNLVVDPVMLSKSGHALLLPDAIESVRRHLLPLASVVTPNIHEAQLLSGREITTVADAKEAARAVHAFGPAAVLVKGGHLLASPGTDLLFDGQTIHRFDAEFIDTPHTHGTGCTYAAAIAAHLAFGRPLVEAIAMAKAYLTEAIRRAVPLGRGRSPVDHFYFLR
jgi:hydroxymethylpyrimidine/phosphomethylpyrimidine kinase